MGAPGWGPRGGPTRATGAGPWALAAAFTAVYGAVSCHNAAAFSPTWGMDLAFFHQLIASAAADGPWGSPLLLEPMGFLEMVHAHLILPGLVGAYRLLPHQNTLLVANAAMACLALVPAWSLGAQRRGPAGGLLAALALGLGGSFAGVATADLRPSALFLPGLLGVFAALAPSAGRPPRLGAALAWAIVATLGRQEACYLLMMAGGAVLLVPWAGARGRDRRRQQRAAVAVLLFGAASWITWWSIKDNFFTYVDPRALGAPPPPLPPDHLADRLRHAQRLALSGLPLGLLSPAPVLAGLPLLGSMATTSREWGPVTGPAAHYPAFYLPFLYAAAISGAARLGRPGLLALALCSALAWERPGWRRGPVELQALVDVIPPGAAVAADYASIHALAGRPVLWNSAQLRMRPEERPRGWEAPWPVPPAAVDYVLAPGDDSLHAILDADSAHRWVDIAPPPRGGTAGASGTLTHRLRARRAR